MIDINPKIVDFNNESNSDTTGKLISQIYRTEYPEEYTRQTYLNRDQSDRFNELDLWLKGQGANIQ